MYKRNNSLKLDELNNTQDSKRFRDQMSIFKQYYVVTGEVLEQGLWGVITVAKKKSKNNEIRACKIIPKNRIVDIESFLNDVKYQRKIDHPNVIRLYENYEDTNCVYLIQEILRGDSVTKRVKKNKFILEKNAQKSLICICRAIAQCHSISIELSNVTTDSFAYVDQEHYECKMKDIWLDKHFIDHKKNVISMENPVFLSPEAILNYPDVKTEVWSIGVMAFYLMSGFPPFLDDNEAKILQKIKMGQFNLEGAEWANVSVEAKIFIRNCLVVDVNKRPSSAELVDSKWIRTDDEQFKLKTFKNMKGNMQNQARYSSFKKVIQLHVGKLSTDEELVDLKELFYSLDKDGSGNIDYDEVVKGLSNQGYDTEEIKTLFEAMDVNHDQKVEQSEFIAAMLDHNSQENSQERFDLIFKYFDQDGDGQIDKKEVMNLAGVDMTETVDYIFNQFDTDGDDRLSQTEFKELMLQEYLKF